jgi:hypothetical protein
MDRSIKPPEAVIMVPKEEGNHPIAGKNNLFGEADSQGLSLKRPKGSLRPLAAFSAGDLEGHLVALTLDCTSVIGEHFQGFWVLPGYQLLAAVFYAP